MKKIFEKYVNKSGKLTTSKVRQTDQVSALLSVEEAIPSPQLNNGLSFGRQGYNELDDFDLATNYLRECTRTPF
jgi:hypothetical protein